VVAIDFGTTYSGYAYAFRRKPDEINLMRRKEAGQVGGGPSHKIPTILLMDEREQFHAFGYDARDTYHDMVEEESRNWLYFEKFKMELHSRKVQNCT
jgi:molecular chaperone DnaK (HSP70)